MREGASICAILIALNFFGIQAVEPFHKLILPGNNCLINSADQDFSSPFCLLSIQTDSAKSVNITCPQTRVLRVVGEYGIFRITCSASYPLDFNYDGVKPTEAINVGLGRVREQNASREALRYQAVVDIFSVSALFTHYKGSNNSVGNITTKINENFKYSRTGLYTFSGYKELSRNSSSFYIFFEEPLVEPAFIQSSDVVVDERIESAMAPCRTTFYETVVKLQLGPNETIENLPFSPMAGFTLHVSNLSTSGGNYTCEFDYDGKKVLMEFPSSTNETRKVECGHKEETGIYSITPAVQSLGFEQWGTTVSCSDVSEARHNNTMILTAIGSGNTLEFRLKREFALPVFMNRSYSLEVGKLDPNLPNQLDISKAIPEQIISAYCGDGFNHETISIVTTIPGTTMKSTFNEEWESIERSEETISRWFKAGYDLQGQEIYGNQILVFNCRISAFVFVAPVIWYVKYKNGTVKEEMRDYSWDSGISYLIMAADSGMESVVCAASMFHTNVWWNATVDINVQGCTVPEFSFNETSYSLIEDSYSVLNCSVTGDPTPTVYWQRSGHNLTSKEGLGYAKLKFKKVQLDDAGEYSCVAINCCGDTLRTFNVDVSAASPSMTFTASFIVMVLALCIGICVGAIVLTSRSQKRTGGLTVTEIEDFISGNGKYSIADYQMKVCADADIVPSLMPYDTKFEVSRKRFQIDRTNILGKGVSGIVYKCLLDERPVAAKENNNLSLKSLLSELKVLMYLGSHDNIVRLLGAHTQDLSAGKAYMFVDYCPFGNLNEFLVNGRSQFTIEQRHRKSTDSVCSGKQFTLRDMFNWSIQIANGMDYLGYKKIIHGDLATRNVLLTGSRSAKITDFGLSNRLYDSDEYIRLPDEYFPWRWAALETLKDSKFSCQSDVWSYGVTLWEIFSLAQTPFPDSCWGLPFVTEVENGMRLEKPDYAGDNLYENVMVECWQKDPSQRPTFEAIVIELKGICTSVKVSAGYVTNEVFRHLAISPDTGNYSSLERTEGVHSSDEPHASSNIQMQQYSQIRICGLENTSR